MTFHRSLLTGLLVGGLTLTGCSRSDSNAGKDATTPEVAETVVSVPPQATPDDPEAVAALTEAGYILTKNDEGNVVEFSIANQKGGIAESLPHLSGIPNTLIATFNGPGIDDAGMENLTSLAKLKRLTLTDTAITDQTLETVGKMTTLEALFLRRTGVTDEGMELLTGLSKLRAIDLRNSNIGDAGMDSLAKIKTLADVQLEKSKVTDEGLVKLAPLPLKSINFNYCTTINGPTMKMLGQTPTLEQLQGDYSKINDAAMAELKGLSKLTRLRIRGCDVTGEGIQHIANNQALARFELRDSSVDDKGLEVISQLPVVTYVDISECRLASPEGIAQLGKLTGLTYLGLWETKTNDETLAGFGELVNLEELNLKSTSITDESLPVLMKMTKLKTLNVAGTQLGDESFLELAKLPNLKSMNVANTSIGFDVIDALAENHPDLQVIEFEN
ncbi:leucine-rich repeat domain-containing protein [Rhodopirellula sp. P2]|uniref:leucine-rich repeat domain-containing protein n=1 Tax=Rhodopirellula sp. P2 TaxID=2127060 RepID=UPI002368056D|nr:adenylate cyclase [Rhodopirellula sp. P2]WDQ16670.1 adenylate cyclase [Rhodopirellula sp. P2]